MTSGQLLLIIAVVALGTMTTRFLPFLIFPDPAKAPAYILYLGKVLPSAIISFLVVYSLKDVQLSLPSHGLPELIAIVSVVLLHLWKRNTLLSIGVGTILYMVLVQTVFA